MNNKIQQNPAIVISCFNRPMALLRILGSLKSADYPKLENIPFVISIDGGAADSVIQIANEFVWPYGDKKVIQNSQNLGVKDHILSCGDLTMDYGSLILLEDDIVVSNSFYFYAKKAAKFYKDDREIAQISLYSYTMSEHTLAQFTPIKNQNDTYFMRWPSSWGQLWTKCQWEEFRNWLVNNDNWESLKGVVPAQVANWPALSWKKFFIAYICSTKKYVVYPYFSFTSLSGEIGQNHKRGTLPYFKTSLANNFKEFNFAQKNKSTIFYDEYFQPTKVLLDSITNLFRSFSYEVDFDGIKKLKNVSTEYLLSIKSCKNPESSYDWQLNPPEMNLRCNKGKMMHFGKTCLFRETLSLTKWVKFSYRYSQLLNVVQEIKRTVLKIVFKLARKL